MTKAQKIMLHVWIMCAQMIFGIAQAIDGNGGMVAVGLFFIGWSAFRISCVLDGETDANV